MTDHIDFGGEPWRAIPRSALRDKRLSPKAKGGLVTLLSHDEGWLRSAIATLQRENRCGRTEAKSIMRELVDQGYAEMTQRHGAGGRFTTGYTVYAIRQVQPAEPVISPGTDTPATVRRGSVSPGSVDLTAVVEAPDLEPLELEPKDAESKAPTAFVDNNPNQPTDRQMYFGERLDVSVPSIVKLNKAHGRAAVLAAMEQLHGFPPADPVENVYGWLDTVACFKAVAV